MTYSIYRITNKLNNKSYIGQSVDVEERWKKHLYDAKRTIGKTATSKKFPIHNALLKYGEDNFSWEIIKTVETLEEANQAEEQLIAQLQTLCPNGYNLLPGGDNRTLPESSKKKISDTLKKTSFFVGKTGILHPNFGTKQSEERKQAQSLRQSGDGSAGKKINSQIARQIYFDYINNENTNAIELGEKYGLKQVAILNILHKKSWKDATKDLPNINPKDRTHGEKWVRSKLREQDVLNIISKYSSDNYTQQELADEYKVSNSLICNIINGKYWKHIKR
jgi:group I intron endonuclease